MCNLREDTRSEETTISSLRVVPGMLLLVAISCEFNQSAGTLAAPQQASETVAANSSSRDLISFLSLVQGERVVAYVRFAGCFKRTEHHLVFEPDSAGMTLALLGPENHQGSHSDWVVPSRPDLPTLWKLDHILEYYRADKPEGWCTSRVTVDLKHYREGHLIGTEHYQDASCPYLDDPTLSGFEGLIQLAHLSRN
jgi:hypothetical protein